MGCCGKGLLCAEHFRLLGWSCVIRKNWRGSAHEPQGTEPPPAPPHLKTLNPKPKPKPQTPVPPPFPSPNAQPDGRQHLRNLRKALEGLGLGFKVQGLGVWGSENKFSGIESRA